MPHIHNLQLLTIITGFVACLVHVHYPLTTGCDTVTANTEAALQVTGADLPDELEEAWDAVFKIVNHFLGFHQRFGFELVAKNIDPSLEDLLLSIGTMRMLLVAMAATGEFEGSDLRLLINAQQQAFHFQCACNALKVGNKSEYESVVSLMKSQAQH